MPTFARASGHHRLGRLALLATLVASPVAAQQDAPAAFDPGWLRVDRGARTATFTLVAGLTHANGTLNFNGFREGGLTLTVPRDWTVVLHFANRGDRPHSAEVAADGGSLPVAATEPALLHAATAGLADGLPPGSRDTVRFEAARPGAYVIFCTVPGHGRAGMWIRFAVSDTASAPSLAPSPPG